MDLITLNSAEEMRNLLRIKATASRFWIGITDRDNEGKFKNYNDNATEVQSFLDWNAGEPNNVGGNEHCVELRRLKFNDFDCTSSTFVACEMKF
jgi:hypothetical protein